MEKVVFHCRLCGIPLTNPLARLTDSGLLLEEDGKDHLPVGFYWVEDGDYYTEAAGQYLVNLKDMVNTERHPDGRRTNGCCGLDGCDGKNVVCLNDHEVGTERSDCWQAHSTALDPEAVTLGVASLAHPPETQ